MEIKNIKISISRIALVLQALVTQTAIGLEGQSFLSEFRKVTGLQEGEYRILSGPESCQEGELQLIPIKNQQDLVTSYSLMLGASPLATDLGAVETTTEERGIEAKSLATYSSKSVVWKKIQWKKSKTVTYEVRVEFYDSGLSYTRSVKNGETKVIDIKCSLKLK